MKLSCQFNHAVSSTPTGCKRLRFQLIHLNFGGIFWWSVGGPTPLKVSAVGHLLFLGLSWTYCNRLQVVTLPADLAQFWGYR